GFVCPDGTVLTSTATLVGADNLGNHTATQNLDMASKSIINVSTIVASGGGLLISGNVGELLDASAGTKFLWYPKKSALRVGTITDSSHWTDGNIGSSSVAFGYNNVAQGPCSVVSGGSSNGIWNSAQNATIGGGTSNIVNAHNSTVCGGSSNQAGTGSGTSATVGGGFSNKALGLCSTVPGGSNNEANGGYSFAAGRRAKSNAQGSFALSDSQDADFVVTSTDTFNTRFAGGYNLTGGTVTITRDAGDVGDILVLSTGTSKVTRFTATGDAYSNGAWNSTGADYAEWFLKDEGETFQPGDVVGLNIVTGKARKYQPGDVLLGVFSSNPGFIGGIDISKTEEELKKDYVLVGLVGQLDYNKNQVEITQEGKVLTRDGKQLGYLLADGKLFLRIKE
ncbi:MAG: hypothetical protein N2Z73_01185, partial [Endomicrobia bacterium]|nr:hypothetical protein [Endomicrobiia bacterium]